MLSAFECLPLTPLHIPTIVLSSILVALTGIGSHGIKFLQISLFQSNPILSFLSVTHFVSTIEIAIKSFTSIANHQGISYALVKLAAFRLNFIVYIVTASESLKSFQRGLSNAKESTTHPHPPPQKL